jgi:cbb3-type cytochrome oxidase maturation protein
MSVLAIVLPLALILAAVSVRACIWAINSGQYDDTDTPPLRMLKDD